MRRLHLCALLAALAAAIAPAPAPAQERPPELVASTEARTPEQERAGFKLPPGFVIELVAAEPDIHKPMNLAFDDRGRLWVTSSLEYPFPAAEGQPARDAVKVLSDFAPDGRARRIETFADGLNIPIGVLPLPPGQGALVHSIPNIYQMVDRDGDGRADERNLWYAAIGSRDTHGMANAFTWGFDGWIYGCHGFLNDSTVAGRDGQAIRMNSGNTYRLRPDGSHIEQWTWGQVNPFGLAFDPLGNLFSSDCHSKPIMMLLRGGYYQSFGKPHDGLGFAPEIMTHDHGSTGIAGIVVYAAEQFPEPYRGSVFIGNVVTSRINHDRLSWSGSSPSAIAQPDFVVSDDPWFRPVDLELGPDGALYIADFYNCIIGHYEVPLTHPRRDRERGRIWRIRYQGTEPHAPAEAPRVDWDRATIAELFEDLGHPNIAVRTKATNQLAWRATDEARAAARKATSDETNSFRRAHGLWARYRLGDLDDVTLKHAAADEDRMVRTHAMKVLGELEQPDESRLALARAGLSDADPFVRRAAAEALGRHPAEANLAPLMNLIASTSAEVDPQLRHAARIALRDQLRRADLLAKAEAEATDAERAILADVALGVPTVEAARMLARRLAAGDLPADALTPIVHHVARHGDADLDLTLLAWLQAREGKDAARQPELVKAMAQGLQERGADLSPAARDWIVARTRRLLASDRPEDALVGADLAQTLRLENVRDDLIALATDRTRPEPARRAALGATLAIDPAGSLPALSRIVAGPDEPSGLREHAANLLAQSGSDEARTRLAEALATAPGRLQPALAAALAANREGAERLLAAVESGKVPARLLLERAVEPRLKSSGLPDIDARLAKLTEGLPPADQSIRALIDLRLLGYREARPDLAAGAAAFQKHCATCHQIGGQGTKIGPQLDGIGVRGAERLLEDVLDPNRNVDQAFRVVTLALRDGQVIQGLPQREEGEILVLADSQGKEIRVPKADIEERQLTPLSLMPANMAEVVPEADFYHLLGYLLSQTETPPQP